MPNELGTNQRPLRVAIVGSGPSGFYAAESLFKSENNVIVGMFERLPAPYGLVRYGVAPDHDKIKNVTKVYEKIAAREGFSFFGNVEIGKDLTIHQLRKFYDAVIFTSGAEADRKLGIEGEDLVGSHTATEFVAWYNGHPDYRDRQFDLSCESVAVIGQGNVAMDVARILCKTIDELKKTDIAQHALDALAESKIKEVHIIGRRGPAQAAFSSSEIKEFGELEDCVPAVDPKELELNYASQTELEDTSNAAKKKNFDILKGFVSVPQGNKQKKLFVQFRRSPAAMYPLEKSSNKLGKVYLERNELIGEPGQQKSRGTGEKEELKCGLLFRSIGYRGIPIKGLPFHDQWGIIPNQEGRVADSEHIFPGLYTAGWIKRGPSGVIGTNKPDSEETVKHLLEDMSDLNPCKNPSDEAIIGLLKELNVRFISFEEWKKIDAAEIARGQESGKSREKFVSLDEMLSVLE